VQLKIKPPLVFTQDDADLFVFKLDKILTEDSASPDWKSFQSKSPA